MYSGHGRRQRYPFPAGERALSPTPFASVWFSASNCEKRLDCNKLYLLQNSIVTSLLWIITCFSAVADLSGAELAT